MIEHTLGEGLSTGGGTEISGETEGLHDGQVSLNGEHGGSGTLLFAEDLTSALVQATVDTADGVFGTLDLDYRRVLVDIPTSFCKRLILPKKTGSCRPGVASRAAA